MYLVIDYVLKNLLETIENNGTNVCTYVSFQSDENLDWIDGINAGLMFGRVEYLQNEQTKLWKPMTLKLTPQVINFPEFHAYKFINEAYFYTRVLPYFEKLAPAKHLFPKFYTSYIEMNVDDDKYLLVFEDLKVSNYVLSGNRSFLDYDHLKLMVRKLGELHAFSYQAMQENRDYFRSLVLSFRETHFTTLKKLSPLIPSLAVRGLDALKRDPKYACKLVSVEKSIKNANGFITDIFFGDRESPLAVLCHGDYIQGHAMFKYENNKPVDMKMIDLASAKLASPVADLASVLYLNADQQMREKHWNDLVNDYYTSLSEKFPQVAPPIEMILKEFSTKALYAYYLASYILVLTISRDMSEPTIEDMLPHEYKGFGYSDIPTDILIPVMLQMGGDKATKALADILRDMIDREFI